MSRLVARILLSIFMFPLAGIVYILQMVISVTVIEHFVHMRSRNEQPLVFGLCTVTTWIFIAAYWSLLWKSSVRWNSHRVIATFVAAAGAFAVALIIGVLTAALIGMEGPGFGTFIGGISAIMLWVTCTVFIWRETAVERAQRIARSSGTAVTCPTCGYNLTGLSESRCPECGSMFTLDELMAAQPSAREDIQ